jgi:hypothetical protein
MAVCRPFRCKVPPCLSLAMPRTFKLFYFTLGDELCQFLSVNFKAEFFQSGVTSATASAPDRGPPAPIPAQCACLPNHGQCRAHWICFILHWGVNNVTLFYQCILKQNVANQGQRPRRESQWHGEGHDKRRRCNERQSCRIGGGGMRKGNVTTIQTRGMGGNGTTRGDGAMIGRDAGRSEMVA